jgi:hypothetical protein
VLSTPQRHPNPSPFTLCHPRPPSPLQLLKGNTFAGSAFFSYGSFWASWAFFQTMARLHADSGFTPDAGFKVGECILLATWGFFTFGFFVPTLRKNGCLMTVRDRALFCENCDTSALMRASADDEQSNNSVSMQNIIGRHAFLFKPILHQVADGAVMCHPNLDLSRSLAA